MVSCNSERLVKFDSVRHALMAVIVLMAVANTAAADDWPNWNGPKWSGMSDETGFASTWPEDGLPAKWTKEIGIGFSSMSVQGERLLAMGHVDGKEKVWCLNATTGEDIWVHEYPGELLPNLHEGGPGATPTIHDGLVYTLGKEGQLFCLQLSDGKVVWEKRLQDELEVKLPEWGFASSGVILGDQVIFEAGRVVSYNRKTGEMLWKSDRHQAGYGSVAVFEHQGKTLLASLDCDGLRVTNSEDGTEVAFTEWTSPYNTNATTPIVVGDLIWISTGYKVGCGLFRLKDDDLEEIYVNKNMKNHFNNSILQNGWLYGFDGDSHNGRNVTLNCVNFETGELAWKQRGLGCGSLLIVDGKILALAEKGDLVLAKADSEKYEELARTKFLDGRCWTMPVLSNGLVYGRNADGKLVCVELPRD